MPQFRRKPKQFLSECLPDEVVNDILTGLPVKSLIRFRCVSKSWNSIITNPIFITTHINRPKSLSNNNGYMLYMPEREDYFNNYVQHLCTIVCNSDRTLTHISTFQLPFPAHIVGFYNGMFCLYHQLYNKMYLWNPNIRQFKMLPNHHLTDPSAPVAIGLAYHSQNNDFKILRIACFRGSNAPLAEAEVYTLSTDSWRRVVISLESELDIGSIDFIDIAPCLFFNGALHSIVFSGHYKFILSFDVNDETFRQIMLPQNYRDGIFNITLKKLAVFKRSLALFISCVDLDGDSICQIWMMREYGVVESWIKISGPVDSVKYFFGCTDSGELLLDTFCRGVVSYDLESLNENNLGIQSARWLSYTTDLMENLVLLDQVKCHLSGENATGKSLRMGLALRARSWSVLLWPFSIGLVLGVILLVLLLVIFRFFVFRPL